MRNLFKFLKKYIIQIITVIVVLAIQANIELSLPSYTSNIINVGIQQSGIEDSVPNYISEETFNKIIIVSGNNNLINYYDVLDKTSDNLENVPLLKNETVYVRNDKEMSDDLINTFGKSFLIINGLTSNEEVSNQIKNSLLMMIPESGLSSNDDIFTILKYVPREQLNMMMEENSKQVSEMPESIITQTAVASVKAEYTKLGIDLAKLQNEYIWHEGLEMLGLAFIAMICSVIVGFLGAKVAALVARDMRKSVYERVMQFGNAEYNEFSTASLITRTTNDIQRISMLIVLVLRMAVFAPIMGIGGIIKILGTDTSMIWIIGLAVFMLFTVIIMLFMIVMPKFKVIQKYIDKLNLVSREILNGIPVIRTFNTQKREEDRFDKANIELTKISKFCDRAMSFMQPAIMLIMNVVSILIIWYGSKGIDAGNLQVGDMMAFIQYAMHIIMSFLFISMFAIMIPRASVSIHRIDEIFKKKISIKDPDVEEAPIKDKRGVVEFDNVSFKYSDSDLEVLKNISFVAKPGSITAIVGSTGSGKSTLVHLIPRLFDVTDGSIKVSGVDVRNMKQETLRHMIGFVPQKGVLFSGTIKSNVEYGCPNLSDEELNKALDIAQASEFVNNLEDKENSEISQNGTNVSGGQKQRLSIARALAIKPDIYIFDDSFSALDFKTDANLRKALLNEVKDSTFIIVAQRISTILNADQIIVLDNGSVVGIGKHEELLKNCEVYKEIAESQLSKEELYHE